MPVYNGGKYIGEAIDSILNQTFTDFEFLIIDDGSTDSSREIILSYDDPRITLIVNNNNIGQANSLNRSLGQASGKYVARMDQDDISLPLRLERQVGFMEENPDIGVSGTFFSFINHKQKNVYHSYIRNPFVDNHELKAQLLFSSCLAHPTVILRNKVLRENNITYESEYEPAEDYRMWSKLSSITDFANIPEFLVLLREHNSQQSITNSIKQSVSANQVRGQIFRDFLGVNLSESQLNHHSRIAIGRFEDLNTNKLSDAEHWLEYLIQLNRVNSGYDEYALLNVISHIWYYFCINSTYLGRKTLRKFYSSPLYSGKGQRISQHISFFLKCCIKHRVHFS